MVIDLFPELSLHAGYQTILFFISFIVLCIILYYSSYQTLFTNAL